MSVAALADLALPRHQDRQSFKRTMLAILRQGRMRASSRFSTPTQREPLRDYARTLAILNDTRSELEGSLTKLGSMLPQTSDESSSGPVTSPPRPPR